MSDDCCPACGRGEPTSHTPTVLDNNALAKLAGRIGEINALCRAISTAAYAKRTPLQMRVEADMLEKRAQDLRLQADRRDEDR